MGLKASTIRAMHKIAGEEVHSTSRLWMLALQAQSYMDPSLWVRRVDVALIGGDPILLSRRIIELLREGDPAKPPRIAILHNGAFSGSPLAALEDPDFRSSMGIQDPYGSQDDTVAETVIRSEVERAAGLVSSRGRGGVLAFEMVQGVYDPCQDEVVLRLTRNEGRSRRGGIGVSAKSISQIEPGSDARGADLYLRSERLFRMGLTHLDAAFKDILETPPAGRRFADLVIAKRCELLSGFISPPRGREDGLSGEEIAKIAGRPYSFAGPPPKKVSQAVAFWRQDFDRARNGPIS